MAGTLKAELSSVQLVHLERCAHPICIRLWAITQSTLCYCLISTTSLVCMELYSKCIYKQCAGDAAGEGSFQSRALWVQSQRTLSSPEEYLENAAFGITKREVNPGFLIFSAKKKQTEDPASNPSKALQEAASYLIILLSLVLGLPTIPQQDIVCASACYWSNGFVGKSSPKGFSQRTKSWHLPCNLWGLYCWDQMVQFLC